MAEYIANLDARKLNQRYITVTVFVKNYWLVDLGLLFIRFGCWLSGINYREGDLHDG